MKQFSLLVLLTAFFFVAGCSGEKRPFTAEFNGKDNVDITYKGKKYTLNRFIPVGNVPFEYSFESDGDLDIEIEGKSYEVDNPYDIDTKKTAKKEVKKKRVVKKKTSSSKKSSSSKNSKK